MNKDEQWVPELVAVLKMCMTDIKALMHDQYGDTAIMPYSHDRASALVEKLAAKQKLQGEDA